MCVCVFIIPVLNTVLLCVWCVVLREACVGYRSLFEEREEGGGDVAHDNISFHFDLLDK
jgi:hypothetical protein